MSALFVVISVTTISSGILQPTEAETQPKTTAVPMLISTTNATTTVTENLRLVEEKKMLLSEITGGNK
jgi:hypothetical protein